MCFEALGVRAADHDGQTIRVGMLCYNRRKWWRSKRGRNSSNRCCHLDNLDTSKRHSVWAVRPHKLFRDFIGHLDADVDHGCVLHSVNRVGPRRLMDTNDSPDHGAVLSRVPRLNAVSFDLVHHLLEQVSEASDVVATAAEV